MKLFTVAAALAGASLFAAAAVQAQDPGQITTPYNAAFAVDPTTLANVCAGGSNDKLHLKFGATTLAAPRASVISFTPLRVGVVREGDTPVNLAFPSDAGCASNPIDVAHAEVRLEGRAEPLMLATSTNTGMSSAARSAIYLRDQGKCPKEGKYIVCKGTQNVNGQKVETYAFIGEESVGASPSGEPYFALCEGSRSQAACEVSDELGAGLSFRIKLPKGAPRLDDIKAVQAQAHGLIATMKIG